jgi:hypothetical protein
MAARSSRKTPAGALHETTSIFAGKTFGRRVQNHREEKIVEGGMSVAEKGVW